MSDVRRLELDKKTDAKIEAVPKEHFMLGETKLKALEAALPEICKLSYWSPEYQAWEPFVTAYLRGGLAPSLASTWLPRLAGKIEEFQPASTKYHSLTSEMVRMYRSNASECFDGVLWKTLEEYVEHIPVYIENHKPISKFLYNSSNYLKLLQNLLTYPEGAAYSSNLAYAVYLYRHCMIDSIHYPDELLKEFQRQLDNYVTVFSDTFNVVRNFIGQDSDVYRWYSKPVKKLICNAWKTSLDLSSKRTLISNADVFAMEVWLSEQLTDYIASLPCSYTESPTTVFIWDALEYAMRPEATLDDPQMIYAFCIPKEYLRTFLEKLSQFYWDVKEGRFIPMLELLVRAQFAGADKTAAKSPEFYKEDLRARGFPVDAKASEDGADED